MDLTFTAFQNFVPYYHHAKFGGNWATNKGETYNNKIPQPE